MTSLFSSASIGTWSRGAVAAGLIAFTAAAGNAQSPHMAAAPLAGGAAALGGSYMDVNGQPIVMPASYTEPTGSYSQYAGGDYPCAGPGGGDPGAAYVDMGGYGPDQCGPYYFDISFQAVVLQNNDAFADVPAFGSIGPSGPTILDAQSLSDDFAPGFQIAGRFDLGPLSLLEMTYMGIYDFGFNQSINSVDVAPGGLDDFLFSAFSNYGDPVAVAGLDNGSVYTLDYQSDLQSTEFLYRRYWLGYSPRVSGTWLAGFRYIRMTEDLGFNALTDVQTQDPQTGSLLWSANNDLVGFQAGGDGWVCLRQGLRIGGETKAGIYNNRFEFNKATNVPDPSIGVTSFSADGNQVAFAGEASVDLVADILPSFSIRAGYRAMYMSSLVTVGNNINALDPTAALFYSQADALYHGFQAGLEYIW